MTRASDRLDLAELYGGLWAEEAARAWSCVCDTFTEQSAAALRAGDRAEMIRLALLGLFCLEAGLRWISFDAEPAGSA